MSTVTANGKKSAGAPAKTYLVVGDLVKVLVDRNDTNGDYVAFETITNPGGGMPILHTHLWDGICGSATR